MTVRVGSDWISSAGPRPSHVTMRPAAREPRTAAPRGAAAVWPRPGPGAGAGAGEGGGGGGPGEARRLFPRGEAWGEAAGGGAGGAEAADGGVVAVVDEPADRLGG